MVMQVEIEISRCMAVPLKVPSECMIIIGQVTAK